MPWTDEALALSYRLAISLGQYEAGTVPSEKEKATVKVTMRSSGVPGIHVPPGTYPVTVTEPAPVPDTIVSGQYGTSNVIRFTFALDGMSNDDGEQLLIDAIANHNLSPLSKLNEWINALGMTPAVGDEVDLDDLVGCHALAQIIDNRGKDGQVYSRVDKVVAAPKTPGKTNGAKAAQKAPTASETPSMITPEYAIDWTVFWAACKAAGIANTEVVKEVDGLDNLKTMDPTDVVELYEILKGRHEGVADADSLPFEG